MDGRLPRIHLAGMALATVSRHQLVDHVFARLSEGQGGWIITVNLDHLRRFATDPSMRPLVEEADVVVADGVPLLWAASLQGTPLPDRVAGSDLVWLLAERAAREHRSLYLLGGRPGSAEGAAQELTKRWPQLRIVGCASPRLATRPGDAEIAPIEASLREADPDIVYVALGAPKQEYLIERLHRHLPRAWWIGVGISLSFIAGDVQRAPAWMQRTGLEWTHRLRQEPRRLAARYLVHDLPFAARLLATAWLARRRRTAARK